MTRATHRLLIAEDDPETALYLAELVRALGMTARIATTLEEIDAAIAEEEYCAALLDKQLPAAAGSFPLTATGDTAQRRLRALDPRRTERDHHVFAILVISRAGQALAEPAKTAFLAKNFLDGASMFIQKPFEAETVTTEILDALERAGRADHAKCASLRVPRAKAARADAGEPVATLFLDGLRVGRRTSFLVNGKRRDLQDARFASFLLLCALRERGSLGEVPVHEIGASRASELMSRVREAVEGAVPDGFSLVQRTDAGLRLHPLVAVEPIDWSLFERHASPDIQAVAETERRRRGKAR